VKLRNNDGTPWVWWIGIPRLILLAFAGLIGFRYAFGLGWVGAAIAVAAAFGLAGALWGTFAWLNATGRQVRLPRRVLVTAARRGRVATTLECPNCHWRGPTSDLMPSADENCGTAFSCPSCGAEIGHSASPD
jgi:predicted RNA-binding Zn-ribbon protein involved in translation (DUF1610 family)